MQENSKQKIPPPPPHTHTRAHRQTSACMFLIISTTIFLLYEELVSKLHSFN